MKTGRTRWSDERIDDLALVVREEIRDLRIEMREGFREVRGEVGTNRRLLMSMWLTTLLGFAALVVEAGLR